jgi:hypothetical protein
LSLLQQRPAHAGLLLLSFRGRLPDCRNMA